MNISKDIRKLAHSTTAQCKKCGTRRNTDKGATGWTCSRCGEHNDRE